MKNNVFLKTLLLVSLACMVGSSNAQTSSEETSTISRTFYKNDGTPLEGVKVIVTKVVKNGRIISRGPVAYFSNASGVVSFTVPQGSTLYMEPPEFNTPVNIAASSGWKYTHDSPQPPGTMSAAGLIVQGNDITVGSTPKDTLDFSTTFNVSASPANEANISINHDSLKARPGSKLTYLHNLFVDRALSAHDETSLTNAHAKALDSNFVLLIPPDYPAAAMTFTTRDTALKLINYATINITASDTIPAGASVVMAGKGRFDISSGKTLTFAGGSRFDGGMQRRFIGAGTVVFGNGTVDRLNAAWFGAQSMSETGGGIIDNVTAIRKAITVYNSSISDSNRQEMEIYLPPGIYYISDSLLFRYHDTVINFEGKLRPYGSYTGYLVVIKGNDTTRTAKYLGQKNRARLSIKRLRLDGRHQSKGIRIEDMMHALLSEIHIERISGAAFKASRFKESVITNLNIHTSKASTDSALLWLDGEILTQDANNGLVFVNPKIEYSGGRYVYISTGATATSLPRNIDFYSPQFHHLDPAAEDTSHGIEIDSTGIDSTNIGDILVQIIKGRDIRFFGGNIRIPASPFSRCVSIGDSSNAPQRIHFYGTVISNTTTMGGMGISVRRAGRIHVEDVTDDVTADSLYISPQIYRRSENNPIVVTFNARVRSKEKPMPNTRVAQPGIVVARTDLQLGVANVLQIADTSAIAINVDRDSLEATPYLEFYSNQGGAGWISIVGDTSKGVMRYQKAARHQFDSTVSVYSSKPRLALTNTDANKITTTVAQAEDTASIVLDVSTATPYLKFYSDHGGDGRIAIIGDSSKGVMRYQRAIRHQFDSTLVTMKNFGVHTTGPKHEISLYSKTPRLALTDTDVNKIMTSVTQAEDTASIVLDVSTATPYLKFYSDQGGDGRITIFGTPNNGVMHYQRALRHQFDSTLVTLKNFGVHTSEPKHEISLYSSKPRLALTNTDTNKITTTVAQAEDTASIVLDISTTTPYLKFYSTQGGDGRIAIIGNKDNGVMRYQRAIRHQFDSTLVTMKNFGVHTSGPRHEISLYSKTPRLALTDIDVNKTTTNVTQAQDTMSIVLDASTTTPSITTKDNAGKTIFTANSNGNLGVHTSGPKHEISLYSSTPRLALTDTDVNATTTTATQAQDTVSILLDASTTTPSITTKDNAGKTIFTANASGNLGIGIGVSPAGRFDVDNDADGTRDSSFVINTNGGVVVGNPTGGNMGPGTVNAKAVYDDSLQLTDFVFESDYHLASIDSMRAFYERHKHLPTIPGREEWKKGKFAVGNLLNYLWETVEVQARYIAELNERLKKVETSR